MTICRLAGGALALIITGAAWADAPLPAEHLTVTQMPPPNPHRLYVLDDAFANEIDFRIHVFDGDTYRRLGQLDAGYYASWNLSPDGGTSAIGTTYFARGSHGARTDVVEFADNQTLAWTHEIVLPPKRAHTLPTPFGLAYSADSHLVYVSYVTPAASFGVLDPAKGSVLGEIDTAGCVLVIPSGNYRVSSICENGKFLTVNLDAQGKEWGRSYSQAFFDPDADPVFVQGVAIPGGWAFLSFLGQVHEVDFSGDQPMARAPWTLVSAAEKGHWRPGGTQVGTYNGHLHRLYVPMHEGGEGSHKVGGTEIWVFDTKEHRRIARWPMARYKLSAALGVHVTSDDQPLLFVATDKADVAVIDASSGRLRHVEPHLGQTPWFMLTH
ncbi:MAG: amine dehydrogenase large subunit [Steroidobacteraceae bacterium]